MHERSISGLERPLPDGITRIQLPMTGVATPLVNVYLIEGDDGFTMVDCGYAMPHVVAALSDELHRRGIEFRRIRTVLTTHYHPDHAGMAGKLVELSGARLLMHAADWRLLYAECSDIPGSVRREDEWYRRNGLEFGEEGLARRMTALSEKYSLKQPDRHVVDGEIMRLGPHRFEIVATPGHTPGHICLFDRERKVVLTGDHVLAKIVPHIGYWGTGAEDPLGSYLASLHKLAKLGAGVALPGHNDPISDVGGRIAELIATHHKRQENILNMFDDRTTWVSPADVAARLPWGRGKFESLEWQPKRLALAATLAQLAHLEARGFLEREIGPSRNRYRRKDAHVEIASEAP